MKVCLNCGCGMVQDKEERCPVCDKPVKNAEPLKSPFGEKNVEPEKDPSGKDYKPMSPEESEKAKAEVENEDKHKAPAGQGNSPANI